MLRSLICCLVLVAGHRTDASLTICAFNIQRLGDTKASDPVILRQLAQILIKCDIVSIEEVLQETAINAVLHEANRLGGPYSLTMSPAMGRTSYKEHLAILFRSDKVSLQGTVKYSDTADVFEREPYSAAFHTTQCSVTNFALMGVHLKPDDVVNEMNGLIHAYDQASVALGTKKVFVKGQNFLIMGDLNADCNYLSTTRYHQTELWTDDRFYFILGAAADTTSSHSTDCAYDRFITAGAMRSVVVPGSVKVYNFETEIHLSEAQAVTTIQST